MINKAEIGIFGGSGMYKFFDTGKWIDIKTPYGKPSDKVFLTEFPPTGEAGQGRKIAFLPRHGRKHQFPPHKINYQANLYAFKKLGVKRIIAPTAAGSLQLNVKMKDFVICDQFVDRTNNRKDTFYNGPTTTHISVADPYCPELRNIAIKACQKNKIKVHKKGTTVVIQGPRFSTRAESKWFTKMGWEVINMTQYPEVILARELEICYVNLSLVTDYDVGLEGEKEIKSVTTDDIIKAFKQNTKNVKKVILDMIKMIPKEPSCKCHEAIKGAVVGKINI